MKAMIIFLVFVVQSTVQLLFAQNLTIEVRNIEKAEGHLYVAIYNSEETFMKKPLAAFRIDVKDTSLSIPCRGLPAGTYAVSLFQDENGNGKLDSGAFGIPLEKFGFSNDAEGVMGPPSYGKCCFTFSEDMTLVIHLK
ncbi:DUF2141 domain-containing protein [uncultured Bacteroides sp.]|uniref:DUF2141 domain-containing protein n=1 Tax=uncultured Bacteroides sp. TaxID=162156 RepID=UPI0025F5FAE9|nr:DUF2141 domain-containing protein [uncultured Bacteroides sp.]